jgi:multisubunit Na+/H+ antiporter MnhC subunit
MSNGHGEKYISKLLFGFGFITAAVLLFYFVVFNLPVKEDWYFWGIATAILFNIGLFLLISAAVHKMKNDMIRRQKSRETQKTFTADV